MSVQGHTCAKCERPARRRGKRGDPLCWGHLKREQRGSEAEGPLAEKGRGRWKRLMDAIDHITNRVDPIDTDAWRAAQSRLLKAVDAYRRPAKRSR